MSGKTIGKSFNYGFAGTYARQPDMIIQTRPNNDTENITFGRPVMHDGSGGVINITGDFTADDFAGIASREVKSALFYADQNSGGVYAPAEPVSVFQRGSISVICSVGAPELAGAVYVRTVAATGRNIGDFEAIEDTGNNVLISNAQWGSGVDANGVAELVLLTRANA